MIRRLRHYWMNFGPLWAPVNASGVLAAMGFLMWSAVGSMNVLVGGLVLASVVCFVLPLAAIGVMARHAARTARVLRLVQFVIIGTVLLEWTGRLTLGWSGDVALVCVVAAFAGTVFWLFSDPRVLTERGARERLRRSLAELEQDGDDSMWDGDDDGDGSVDGGVAEGVVSVQLPGGAVRAG
ncbi:MAG: hypothetical protein ACTS3F_11120 [Phycisphaerales bacterium]